MNRSNFRTAATLLCWVLCLTTWLAGAPFPGAQAPEKTRQETDSSTAPQATPLHIRGLEKMPADYGAPWRAAANVLLFVPRTVLAGLLYPTGYGSRLIDDSKGLEGLEDFFYIYDRRVGWFPLLDFSSGSSLAYGARLFYRQKPFGLSAGGFYANSDLWKIKAEALYAFRTGRTAWHASLSGQILTRDDYKFHGFGSNPATDPRNVFLPGAGDDFGLFAQRISKVQLILGIHPASRLKILYTGFYQKRNIGNPSDADSGNIGSIFDLSSIPGIQAGRPTIGQQIYNELAIRIDTREHRGKLLPGARLEVYGGYSAGVGNDDSRFLRAGFDGALFIPVIKHNRLIVPRLVLDAINNQNDGVPISFAEYPRQPTFRGASGKRLLRTDEVSMVPSIEYQWPLTFNVSGHLFVDYLFAGGSLSKLTSDEAPYAIGFGIDVHGENSELARFSVAGGSEGLRILLSVGLPNSSNDRSDWQ